MYFEKFPRLITSQGIQLMNLKSYDEAYLLRQCFTISITTIKTVTQTQAKPICLSNVDSFFSFTPSVLVSSCLVEVVSLSAFTSVLSSVAVSFFLFLLKSPSICPSASNGGFSQTVGRFSGIIDTEINHIVAIGCNQFIQRGT